MVPQMKKQTGMWVDSAVWQAYKDLCRTAKLRPAEPIEGFLDFVLQSGSVLTVLNLLKTMRGSEGYEAYARVLLSWYREGRQWMDTDDDEVSIEPMLLETLKHVADSELRKDIETALIERGRDGATVSPEKSAFDEKFKQLKKLVKGK